MKVIIYFALALLCVNAININQQAAVAGGDAADMEDDMPLDMTEEEFDQMMMDEGMMNQEDMTDYDMGDEEMMGGDEEMPPKKGRKAAKKARKAAKKVVQKAKKAKKAAKGGKTQLLLQGDAMMTGTTGMGDMTATDMGDMTATDMGDMTATDMGEMMGPMMTGDDEMVGGEGTYPMGAPEMMTGGDGPMVGGNGTYPMGAPENGPMDGGDGPMVGGDGTYPMGAPEMMTGGDGPDAGKNGTGHGDEDRDCSKVCSPEMTGMDCEASCSGCFEVPMGHCERKQCAAKCGPCGHCVGAVPEDMTLDQAVGEFQKMMKGGKKGGKGEDRK